MEDLKSENYRILRCTELWTELKSTETVDSIKYLAEENKSEYQDVLSRISNIGNISSVSAEYHWFYFRNMSLIGNTRVSSEYYHYGIKYIDRCQIFFNFIYLENDINVFLKENSNDN